MALRTQPTTYTPDPICTQHDDNNSSTRSDNSNRPDSVKLAAATTMTAAVPIAGSVEVNHNKLADDPQGPLASAAAEAAAEELALEHEPVDFGASPLPHLLPALYVHSEPCASSVSAFVPIGRGSSSSSGSSTARGRGSVAPSAAAMVASKPVFVGDVADQLKAVLGGIDVDECDVDGEGAFFVADLSEVYRQHLRWMRELPRIVPFYAVKCNPDPFVLRLLASLGTGFDCASNGEIQSVLDLGVHPSRIIYANPCKASSFVRQAAKQRVELTTFDNLDELSKIARFYPGCKLVVRILTDDSKSVCQLGLKFGAPLDSVPRLLARARELHLDVVGVSFHVGSGCYDPESFRDAVRRARTAFDMGKAHGYAFDLLDVGGGYDHGNFEMIARVLNGALDEFFPADEFRAGGKEMQGKQDDLRIIAEPGRYYVSRAFVLAANIIARRDGRSDAVEQAASAIGGGTEADQLLPEDAVEQGSAPGTDSSASTAIESIEGVRDKPQVMLYQNDGVYGAFNCIMFDHQVVHPKVLTLHRRYAYRPDLDAPGVELPEEEEDEEEQVGTHSAATGSEMATTVANIDELTQALTLKSLEKARARDDPGDTQPPQAIAVPKSKALADSTDDDDGSALDPHSSAGSPLKLIPCSVWGPTCDSIDCVRELSYLPRGLAVGDWLVYENMGAYTLCAASSFNGLRRSDVRYTIGAQGEEADVVKQLLGLGER